MENIPNLEEFTTEMSAYNEGVLKEAPERLKQLKDIIIKNLYLVLMF